MYDFECIMSDPEDGATYVLVIQADWFEDAVRYAEELVTCSPLWEGFRPFIPSTLSE